MEKDYIEGKVIELPNEINVIIDKGYVDGVEEDSTVVVFEPGYEVKSLETNQILGTVEFNKAELIVISLYDNFAICGEYIYEEPPFFRMGDILSRQSAELKKLPLNQSQIQNFAPKKLEISIGDFVKIYPA